MDALDHRVDCIGATVTFLRAAIAAKVRIHGLSVDGWAMVQLCISACIHVCFCLCLFVCKPLFHPSLPAFQYLSLQG